MAIFDPKRPVESFKALVLDLMKGYRFDVEGLYLKDGTVRPLPSEASVVGKVVEITIHEHLSRKLLQQRQLKSIPAQSDRVYPDVSFNGQMIFPNKFALDVKCARRAANGKKTESAITIGTFDAEYFRYPEEKVGNIMMPYGSYTAHLSGIRPESCGKRKWRNLLLTKANRGFPRRRITPWKRLAESRSSGFGRTFGSC